MTSDALPPTEPAAANPVRRSWNVRKSLRWFFAEFLVVVAGVLVALAVSAWWQGRQDREHERQYLQQLDADLLATENGMHDAITFLVPRAVAAAAVEHAFWGERPASNDALNNDFSLPWSTRRFRPVLGNIEALISSGDINVIRSASLRTHLVAYVEWSRARLDDVNRYDETYYRPAVNEMQSQFDISTLHMDLWRKKNMGQPHAFDMNAIPATGSPPFPVDLDAVLKNRIVYNAYSKLMLAHRNQSAQYGSILERARFLHAQVYRQLHGVDEPGNCQLARAPGGKDYEGSCGAMFATGDNAGATIRLRLHSVDAITSGRWKAGEDPAEVAAGKLVVAGSDDMDVELQTSLVGDGLLRTQLGWFPVTAMELSDDESRLGFRIDTRHEVAANSMDVAILKQAKALLGDATQWDRHDDRECSPDKHSLSLYCALIKSSLSESGGTHHRRPALEIVRMLVDQRSVGRGYQHRLRDYNNDPRTSLDDVQKLLDEAIVIAQRTQAKDTDTDQ